MAYSVEQISDKVKGALSNCQEVIAALLMGSCARGEETYFINKNGDRELLSDYEMLIIVQDNCSVEESNRKLRTLANELKSQSWSPCFELEWSYKTIGELRKLDKRFIFFEAKESAYVICGKKEAIKMFPNITIDNLNYCELNTVLIHRLYHVIRDYMIADEHYQKYLIARNTLDLPTAILPLIGILQSTYECRNRTFRKYASEYDFSENLVDRLDDYLCMKKNYDADEYSFYTVDDMRNHFVEDMKSFYRFQKKMQNGHAFKKNNRLFLSGVYRRNIKLIRMSIQWENMNEELYKKMIYMLENGNVTKDGLKSLQDEMFDIYSYR